MTTREAFGARVRTIRKQSGISLRQFAQTIGIDKNSLLDIELGRTAPTLDTIEKISCGLGVPMSALLEGIGSVPATPRKPLRWMGDTPVY